MSRRHSQRNGSVGGHRLDASNVFRRFRWTRIMAAASAVSRRAIGIGSRRTRAADIGVRERRHDGIGCELHRDPSRRCESGTICPATTSTSQTARLRAHRCSRCRCIAACASAIVNGSRGAAQVPLDGPPPSAGRGFSSPLSSPTRRSLPPRQRSASSVRKRSATWCLRRGWRCR